MFNSFDMSLILNASLETILQLLCAGFRLAGNESASEGRLEMSYNGVWGTVCDDSFDNTDAAVACYTLGYG